MNNSARFALACLAGSLAVAGGCSLEAERKAAQPSVLATARLAATQLSTPALIPMPVQVRAADGAFVLGPATRVEFAPGAEVRRVATHFTELLSGTRATRLAIAPAGPTVQPGNAIHFQLLAVEGGPGEEGYSLHVSPQRIVVSATHPRGLFYGAVTLWQLLTAAPAVAASIEVAAMTIEDAPRFRWRGLMLDVARHYMPPAFIKQLLDQMALHKLNTFHWHLTDDQGWRLEIKKYPRLTAVGAWRQPAGAAGAAGVDGAGKPVRYGGYYTQEDVRDIVSYAAERFITVVPEIEMPGHAQAAIAAYPELGVDGVEPPVSSDWGVHTHLFNVEEPTFEFLQNVLDEVVDLFPGRYVHVGGDEAAKDQWEGSARVQVRMRELGIQSEMQLQSYFIRRIERHLNARGRILIGWDEILEGGIAPNAAVMSWRGAAGGIEAARQGHDVVMAPAPVLYLDHLQSDAPDEPPGRPSLVTLADIYAFEPVPSELGPHQVRHVLGAQVNAWTEHMRTPERVEHAVFPRLAALAELTWSQRQQRDFASFLERLQPQLERYEAMGVRYARSALEPNATAQRLKGAAPVSRRDEELRTCSDKLALHLEDDAPEGDARAVFLVDIMDPCWIHERAPLDGMTRLAVTVGQVPFNFQLWKDAKNVVRRPATTAGGSLQVRVDSCTGTVIADLPLAPAGDNPALTRLEVGLPALQGTHDLCLAFGTGKTDPLWVIDRVELLP